MPDEQPHDEPVVNERINVFISPAAKAMMEEMGRVRYPNLKRSSGLVVEEALRQMYAAFKRAQKREERN